MQVDTATLEETESLVYAMLLFVLINHVWITSIFVDVTENLAHEKSQGNIKMVHCESVLVECPKKRSKFQVQSATSLASPFYQTHASKYKNPLWQNNNLGCQRKVANDRRLWKSIIQQPIVECYHANPTLTSFWWIIFRKRRLEEVKSFTPIWFMYAWGGVQMGAPKGLRDLFSSITSTSFPKRDHILEK
jgi:hypothetical protein